MESHRLNNGKVISYQTYGKADGEPLFYFHGFPGCHHEIDLFKGDELAKKNNIRLIVVNRPGYGNSDIIKNRRLLDWPGTIISIADQLKIGKFSIFGCSGGSPYALICAKQIPDRIKTIGIISGMAPFKAPGMKISLSSSIPRAPGFIQDFILNNMRKMLQKNPEKLILNFNKRSSIPDKELMEKPEIKATFINVLKEALRKGNKGVKIDAKIYKSNWGFRISEIEKKVFLWHGEKDENVKLLSGKYVSEQLQNCDSKFFPNEGHFSLLINNSTKIFERFVSDFDRVKN